MSLLTLIWLVSLLLAGAALAVMTALVLVRLVVARNEQRRALRRRKLVHRLLSGEPSAPGELGQLPRDLVAETFVELIRLVRGEERATFVALAGALGVPEHFQGQLRRGAPRERMLAVQALGQLGDERSIDLLRGALTDRRADIRLAAALSLAEAGNSADVETLVRDLGLGSDEDSSLAVSLFRMLSGERMDEVKALIVSRETSAAVRLAAIEAVAESGDFSLVPVITQLALDAPDEAVELPRYLRALGQLGHPAARPAVLDGLGRRPFGVRAAAAGAAGRIGLVEFAGRLSNLLDDSEWWVRFRAAEALLRLGEPGVEQLRKQAAVGSPQARHTAAAMLAERKIAS